MTEAMRLRTFAPVLLAMAIAACQREPPPRESWVPVRVHVVESASAAAGTRYSANVTPRAQVDVSFKVNGYIADIRQLRGADGHMRPLQQGDVVKQGTVLAKVRDTDYVDKVKRAQADLARSQAGLVKANADFKRATDLIATQSITQPDYDSAQREHDSARANVDAARAQLDEAQLNLSYTSLIAPFDGVILSRKIELGSLVGPGSVGFVLADVSAVKVLFSVPDVMLKHVALGNALDIVTESVPGTTFNGKVTAVAPSADSKTRSFTIEVTIANAKGTLRDGMVAALAVPAGAAPAASGTVVPLAAIVRPQSGSTSYAVYAVLDEGGKQIARVRPVELGPVLGNTIVVTAGLKPGDRVVVTGTSVVKDGNVVRIAP